MGKIKSKLIRRTATRILEEDISFNDNFENNKILLGKTMPSKKIRNQVAGLLTKIKKEEKIKKEQDGRTKEQK
jgi:ribosomal protein S17E|tara:strand:- start:638 stop:856 length:219 start_codon:yes stop_codon:yes gene_type:complete